MLAVFVLMVLAGVILWYVTMNTVMTPETGDNASMADTPPIQQPAADSEVTGTIEKPVTINYGDLGSGTRLTELMKQRKEALGLKESVDFIVRSDESFTIGGTTVAMRDILEKAFLKKKAVFEERIEETGAIEPDRIKNYGIYIVQPMDNIWNIHFRIIQEYYATRGISVCQTADEPIDDGRSSGIGKLLKFSETLVIIYNLEDRMVADNIDLLKPLTKIVVYSMDDVFNLLNEIDYDNVDSIRFDGETIWIPAKQPSA